MMEILGRLANAFEEHLEINLGRDLLLLSVRHSGLVTWLRQCNTSRKPSPLLLVPIVVEIIGQAS